MSHTSCVITIHNTSTSVVSVTDLCDSLTTSQMDVFIGFTVVVALGLYTGYDVYSLYDVAMIMNHNSTVRVTLLGMMSVAVLVVDVTFFSSILYEMVRYRASDTSFWERGRIRLISSMTVSMMLCCVLDILIRSKIYNGITHDTASKIASSSSSAKTLQVVLFVLHLVAILLAVMASSASQYLTDEAEGEREIEEVTEDITDVDTE